MNHLFCFGLGFSARALVARLDRGDWRVTATCRSAASRGELETLDVSPVAFDGSTPLPDGALDGVSHLLVSIPPGKDGDPVLAACRSQFAARAGHIRWAGYLSTTGVYGDRQGGWVDENSELAPTTERGRRRVQAESGWLALYREHGLPVHVFRLAGIYGPGRNQLESLKAGTARRIVKPGQVFSRIHVADIAGILLASIASPDPGTVYNVCDDEAAPPQEVVAHAARILGTAPPPEIAFDDAEMSAMGRSFYAESKRVSNARITQQLGYVLQYPTYREGLAQCLAAMAVPAA